MVNYCSMTVNYRGILTLEIIGYFTAVIYYGKLPRYFYNIGPIWLNPNWKGSQTNDTQLNNYVNVTLSITAFSIMTLSIMAFSITTLDIEWHYAECHLCQISFMLSFANMLTRLSVNMMNIRPIYCTKLTLQLSLYFKTIILWCYQ